MSATRPAILPQELRIVHAVVARHLPAGTRIWVYGSRATGEGVWRGSDLDLMIDAGKPLELGVFGMMDEEFSESPLPYKVDLHDRHRTAPAFMARISPGMVPLPGLDAASGEPPGTPQGGNQT